MILWAVLVTGDIVGFAVDLDSEPNEMRFFLNGRDLGAAYSGFEFGSGTCPRHGMID